ncbi:MAG: tetratricopeptide repeat protein [Pyrinomonadaceae bacterium]
MKKIFNFLALFCVCVFVFASQVSAKDIWINVRSKHFNLIGNASEKDIRGVATKLEQFRETFHQIFPKAKFNASIGTNVVVFKSDSAYNPFKPKRADGKVDKWIAGYFQPGEDLNYITLSTDGDKEDAYGTIFHEYVHFLLDTNFGKSEVPPWFNEGLAEYYQTFKIENDQKVSLGLLQDGHLQLLQQNKLIPLETFFKINNYSLHQNGNHSRSIFYAQAWALVHYLIQGNKGVNNTAMNTFLNLVMKNVEPEKAFQQAFQRDYAAMEKELEKYVRQRNFTGTSVMLKDKLVFDAEMTTAPLSEAEANAYLGDLLYHTNETADAEKYLQTALALDANSVMANTSFGLVKMRQRKFAEAKNFLEKAIAGDAKNHYAHYNYAYVLSREDMDESGFTLGYAPEKAALMRRSLQKAIELKPDFTESYRLMAFVNLVNNENLDESLALLKKGLTYQPGNQDYALLEAQILLRQEKFAEARTIADKLAKTAGEQYMRANAENILRAINQVETAKNNYQKQADEISSSNESATAPTLVRRSNINEEDRGKIREESIIDSLNQMIEKPKTGEQQLVGYIVKITCPNGTVEYSVKTETETMTLASKDFVSLSVVAMTPEAENYQIGCNADLQTARAVITYRLSAGTKSKSKGDVIAVYFVPKTFRLKSETEIAESEGKQEILKEDEMRSGIEQGIREMLRKPEAGEKRELVNPDKIECVGRSIIFVLKSDSGVLKLKTETPQNVRIISFSQNFGSMQLGCGIKLPSFPAVVTYRPSADEKDNIKGEVIALEFVPEGFKPN